MFIHPRYVFGAIEPSTYEAYRQKNRLRGLQSYKAMSEMMIKNSLVKVKDHPPYTPDVERKVLLNSLARATFDPKTREYSFKSKLPSDVPRDTANVKAVSYLIDTKVLSANAPLGVGVDQGLFCISSIHLSMH